MKLGEAGGREGGEDDSGDDDGDEPMPGGTVEVLTDENFERITQAATGATTGDWFVGERCSSPLQETTTILLGGGGGLLHVTFW